MILESQYVFEKQAFTKLLIGARMLEITYSETFNLVFYKSINCSEGDEIIWITIYEFYSYNGGSVLAIGIEVFFALAVSILAAFYKL